MTEQEITKIMEERDHWEFKANELAEDIGEALGVNVGVHTSSHCPVQAAIDCVYEMRAQIEEWRKSS